VDWAQLRAAIQADPPADGELVYIGRHGTEYSWSVLGGEVSPPGSPGSGGPDPDAWMYYAGPWPGAGLTGDREQAFYDDLLAELESMTGGADRCRWPLDEPWPHGH